MKNIDIKIKECRESIDSLIRMLKLVGSGIIVMIGIYGFLKEEFSVLTAQSVLIVSSIILIGVLFAIFRKYAIIERLNLKERK